MTNYPRRLALLVLVLLLALVPVPVLAHVRWFTPRGPYWDPEWDRVFSLPVLLALLSGGAVVALLFFGQKLTGDPLWPRPPFVQRLEPAAPAILGVQAAIALIFSATRLELFVPNIELPFNVLGFAVAGITIAAAFSFITGVLTRIGALIIAALFLVAFAFGSWYEVLEQVLFVGIAFYLVAVGRGVVRYDDDRQADDREDGGSSLTDTLTPHALTMLRITAGFTVLILGFTEKLLAPDLGVAFIQEYPHFNVPRELGFSWFTDERFVFAAGIVEVTTGLALLSGYLTRVVIVALWIPFNLGIPFLPPEELIGHLPILATMYVLLVRGTEGIPPQTASEPDVEDPDAAQRPAAALTRG